LCSELFATHDRHDYVGQEQMDWAMRVVRNLNGLHTVCGLKYRVAATFQDFFGQSPERFGIFHQ